MFFTFEVSPPSTVTRFEQPLKESWKSLQPTVPSSGKWTKTGPCADILRDMQMMSDEAEQQTALASCEDVVAGEKCRIYNTPHRG